MSFFDIFKRKNNVYCYTEEEMEQFENFVEENWGKYYKLFHEVVSPDVHIDIIIVPPTDRDNYYKLVTMGMGSYTMKIPSNLHQEELERAELVIYLPANWSINSSEDKNFWPINILRVLARYPLQSSSWLGIGHTISIDANNTPFANNTGFCSILLLEAFNRNFQPLNFRLKEKGKINFYQIFPLYKEELEYAQNNDSQALLNLFSNEDINPVVNINRKNYGK